MQEKKGDKGKEKTRIMHLHSTVHKLDSSRASVCIMHAGMFSSTQARQHLRVSNMDAILV